jgi:hypothetical protein
MTPLPVVPEFDTYVWAYVAWAKDFVTVNIITITCVMGLLKIIAKKTPWAYDDKIVTLLRGFIPTKPFSILKTKFTSRVQKGDKTP